MNHRGDWSRLWKAVESCGGRARAVCTVPQRLGPAKGAALGWLGPVEDPDDLGFASARSSLAEPPRDIPDDHPRAGDLHADGSPLFAPSEMSSQSHIVPS